jgi:hypothetical protein
MEFAYDGGGLAKGGDVTWTPEDSRSHYGVVSPAEQYAASQASPRGNPWPLTPPRWRGVAARVRVTAGQHYQTRDGGAGGFGFGGQS